MIRRIPQRIRTLAIGDSPQIAPLHRRAPPKVPRRVPHVLRQWKALVLRIFKSPTQHGYRTVQRSHPLSIKAWRLLDIERLAIQQWVADNFGKASNGRRMERAVLLSSNLEGCRSASNRGWSFADEAEIATSLTRLGCWSALTRRLSPAFGRNCSKLFPGSGPFVRCVRAGTGAPVTNRVDTGSWVQIGGSQPTLSAALASGGLNHQFCGNPTSIN